MIQLYNIFFRLHFYQVIIAQKNIIKLSKYRNLKSIKIFNKIIIDYHHRKLQDSTI